MISTQQNILIIAQESNNEDERLKAIKKLKIKNQHLKFLEEVLITEDSWKVKREVAKLLAKHFPREAYDIITYVFTNEKENLKLIELYRDLLLSLDCEKSQIKNAFLRKIKKNWSLREKLENRFKYYERKAYPDLDLRKKMRSIREHKSLSHVSEERDYPAFLWAKQRFSTLETDKRTAQYQSSAKIQDRGGKWYYCLRTWTESVGSARSNGFSYRFDWATTIIRFEDGHYETHKIRL